MSEQESPKPEGRDITPKEAQLFLAMLNSMKSAPDIDWDLVASALGLASANSAKTRYSQIKKSLGVQPSAASGGGVAAAPKKRAKKEKEVGTGTNKTPSKVAKTPGKRGRPKKSAAVAKDEDSDMGEGGPVGGDSPENPFANNPFHDKLLTLAADQAQGKGEAEETKAEK